MNIIPHKTAAKNALVSVTTFTGKERDAETGYSYFGARYYDSDLSGLFAIQLLYMESGEVGGSGWGKTSFIFPWKSK